MRALRYRNIVLSVLLPALWPTLIWAEVPHSVGIVTSVTGRVSLTRAIPPIPRPLKFRDDLFKGDVINTAENSVARVLLGGKALVTVRELSNFTITEEPNKPTLIDLISGKLALAVARLRMGPGEAIVVNTPNAVAAVRGTLLTVEVEPAKTADASGGSGTTFTRVSVLEGTVAVSASAQGPPVLVNAMQTVGV